MKKLLLILLVLFAGAVNAERIYPGKWTFSVEEKKEGQAELIFKLKLDKGWHTYSQFTPDGGPFPMVFTFDSSTCFTRVGKVNEPKPLEKFEDVFGINTLYFHDGVTVFRQLIKYSGTCIIKGNINFQVCQESCIEQDTLFSFQVGKANTVQMPGIVQSPVDSIVKNSVDTPQQSTIAPADTTTNQLEDACGKSKGDVGAGGSLIEIFIGGFLGGFIALMTPCVFPMIPMTVSFFTKRSGSRRKGIRNALIYASSIIFIYVSLGLIVTAIFGSEALNDMASNAFFNLSFFVIFVIFAMSFFGAFEITLPSWIINKADSASDRGGLIGIFFMAFTLCLVSFSCTGPIIGTLLVEAGKGSYLGPFFGMLGFSVALAIPFAVFSMFPEWMNSLPKSGGWLNTVKVTLGFIELALALKFLSNVDLAYHWEFLKRELFIGLWIIICLFLGFYLLGKLKLSHDSDVPFIPIGRLMTALLVFTFALYLTPGIWGAPLKLISGFPPPENYKEWNPSPCPHDITCFHDYDEGMLYAKQQGKPVIIDFTGWSCVNCRKMEDFVWSNPKVLKRLRNEYVLISLYVDDKEKLPVEKQFVSSDGKQIKTTGHKWKDFQKMVYNTSSQPYYVLVDNKGKVLAEPRGGLIEVDKYVEYLDEGLCRYKLRK